MLYPHLPSAKSVGRVSPQSGRRESSPALQCWLTCNSIKRVRETDGWIISVSTSQPSALRTIAN